MKKLLLMLCGVFLTATLAMATEVTFDFTQNWSPNIPSAYNTEYQSYQQNGLTIRAKYVKAFTSTSGDKLKCLFLQKKSSSTVPGEVQLPLINGKVTEIIFYANDGASKSASLSVKVNGQEKGTIKLCDESNIANSKSPFKLRFSEPVIGEAISFGANTANNVQITKVVLTIEDPSGNDDLEPNGLAWSASSALANIGEDFEAPTLTNPNNLDVSYGSINEDVATISEEGVVTIKKYGTTTISATFAGDDTYSAGSVSYTLTVVGKEAGLSFSESNVSVNLGEEFTAPTLTNPNNLPVTYASSNQAVATVAADGAVTIADYGTTVISATFAGDDTYVASTVQYTLKVINPTAVAYQLVTDLSQLYDGAHIILVGKNKTSGKFYGMSAKEIVDGHNRSAISVEVENDLCTPSDEIAVLILHVDNNAEAFKYAFYISNGLNSAGSPNMGYLYAPGTADDNGKNQNYVAVRADPMFAKISSKDNLYNIIFDHNRSNQLQFNSSATIFACYTGTQTDLQIYIDPRPRALAPVFEMDGEEIEGEVAIAEGEEIVVKFPRTEGHTVMHHFAVHPAFAPESMVMREESELTFVEHDHDNGFTITTPGTFTHYTAANGYTTARQTIEVLERVIPANLMLQNNGMYLENGVISGEKLIPEGDEAPHFQVTFDKDVRVAYELEMSTTPEAVRGQAPAEDAYTNVAAGEEYHVPTGEGTLYVVTPGKTDATATQTYPYSVTTKETTGVEGVQVASSDDAEYYNLQGVRVEHPAGGVFIRVSGGRAVKVAL